MIWIVGLAGLFAGFVAGQAILYHLLRGRSKQELLTDKKLQLRYGLFNWLIAFLAAWLAVWVYQNFFVTPP